MLDVALAAEGPGAPPRENGELAFTEPWQPRVFAIAVDLAESGRVPWTAFQAALIDAIEGDAAERLEHADDADEGYRYWDCWLVALSRTLAAEGLCSAAVIEERSDELRVRDAHR